MSKRSSDKRRTRPGPRPNRKHRPRSHTPERDDGLVNPRAWFNAKHAFGPTQYGLTELFAEIERVDGTSCRFGLAVAIHAYTQLDEQGRRAARAKYNQWFEQPRARTAKPAAAAS